MWRLLGRLQVLRLEQGCAQHHDRKRARGGSTAALTLCAVVGAVRRKAKKMRQDTDTAADSGCGCSRTGQPPMATGEPEHSSAGSLRSALCRVARTESSTAVLPVQTIKADWQCQLGCGGEGRALQRAATGCVSASFEDVFRAARTLSLPCSICEMG